MRDKKFSASASISRRRFLGAGAGCILASPLLAPSLCGAASIMVGSAQPDPLYFGPGTPDYPVVTTRQGRVRGISLNGISIFKGLHYGADTGGKNRFMPPRPPASWDGVRDAFFFGTPCPQIIQESPFYVDPVRPSEDCLVLNIWSPKQRNGADSLPVMVWIHGGAFVNGSGGLPAYDGFNLAAAGNVLVVTLNHRLNVFGYTFIGEKDDRFATSGNVGQLDLVAALQWVQQNIEFFGGDPGNVTVFGQSGGGAKIGTLIAMPSAKNTFHKAIIQSGSLLKVSDKDAAIEVAEQIFAHFKLKPSNASALQDVPPKDLLAAYQNLSPIFSRTSEDERPADRRGILNFAPVVDGYALAQHPWASTAPEMARSIALMIGTSDEETASFLGERLRQPVSSDAELLSLVADNQIFGDLPTNRYPRLLEEYKKQLPDASRTELLVRLSTDIGMWRNALIQADAKLFLGGPPLYMYNFAWKNRLWGGSWAAHGNDLNFQFGFPDAPGWMSEEDSPELRAQADPHNDRYRVAKEMMAAWAAFAHSGNPSTSTLDWPAYDIKRRATMVFDHESRVVDDPRAALRRLVV
jgi:para-nitrobenzyl esterase